MLVHLPLFPEEGTLLQTADYTNIYLIQRPVINRYINPDDTDKASLQNIGY
jgi:hypothetical protein